MWDVGKKDIENFANGLDGKTLSNLFTDYSALMSGDPNKFCGTLGEHIESHHMSGDQNALDALWRKARKEFSLQRPIVKGNFTEDVICQEGSGRHKLDIIAKLTKECLLKHADEIARKLDGSGFDKKEFSMETGKIIGKSFAQIGRAKNDYAECADTKLTVILRNTQNYAAPIEIVTVYPQISEYEQERILSLMHDKELEKIIQRDVVQNVNEVPVEVIDQLGNKNISINNNELYVMTKGLFSKIQEQMSENGKISMVSNEEREHFYHNTFFNTVMVDCKATDLLKLMDAQYISKDLLTCAAEQDGVNLITALTNYEVDYSEKITEEEYSDILVAAFKDAYTNYMQEDPNTAQDNIKNLINEMYESGATPEDITIQEGEKDTTIDYKNYLMQEIEKSYSQNFNQSEKKSEEREEEKTIDEEKTMERELTKELQKVYEEGYNSAFKYAYEEGQQKRDTSEYKQWNTSRVVIEGREEIDDAFHRGGVDGQRDGFIQGCNAPLTPEEYQAISDKGYCKGYNNGINEGYNGVEADQNASIGMQPSDSVNEAYLTYVKEYNAAFLEGYQAGHDYGFAKGDFFALYQNEEITEDEWQSVSAMAMSQGEQDGWYAGEDGDRTLEEMRREAIDESTLDEYDKHFNEGYQIGFDESYQEACAYCESFINGATPDIGQ